MEIRQYDIVLVNLDPTIESEMQKTRPCLVVSPNEMNRHLRTIVIAPMTTSERSYPTRVPIRLKGKLGAAAIDQIRTIDRKRIIKSLGRATVQEISRCKDVIRETFVD